MKKFLIYPLKQQDVSELVYLSDNKSDNLYYPLGKIRYSVLAAAKVVQNQKVSKIWGVKKSLFNKFENI